MPMVSIGKRKSVRVAQVLDFIEKGIALPTQFSLDIDDTKSSHYYLMTKLILDGATLVGKAVFEYNPKHRGYSFVEVNLRLGKVTYTFRQSYTVAKPISKLSVLKSVELVHIEIPQSVNKSLSRLYGNNILCPQKFITVTNHGIYVHFDNLVHTLLSRPVSQELAPHFDTTRLGYGMKEQDEVAPEGYTLIQPFKLEPTTV